MKVQGRNEHKGMIMEYEHQPSGAGSQGRIQMPLNVRSAQNDAQSVQTVLPESTGNNTLSLRDPYAGISFNFLVLPIHRYQYSCFRHA